MRKRLSGLLVVAVLGSAVFVSCGEQEPPAAPGKPAEVPKDVRELRGNIVLSMQKAIAYLRDRQREDGSWGNKQFAVGITGLIVNALAQTPEGLRPRTAEMVGKGVKFLLSKARPSGAIVVQEGMAENYQTSIAAVALLKLDREKYQGVIDAAVNYTKGIQGADSGDQARFGSMGYGSDKTKGDIMNTMHAVEFLSEAGLSKDSEEFKRALVFLGRTQNLSEYAEEGVQVADDGGAAYRPGESKAGVIKLPDGTEVPKSYGGATYALLKSLLFMGMKKDHPRVVAAYGWIGKHYTLKEHPEMGAQGLYYYYYTMSRTLELWGSPTLVDRDGVERNWAMELAAEILSRQKPDGPWANAQDRWNEGDPALVTGYCLLSLDICHRMLR